MKHLIPLLACLFLALPAWATEATVTFDQFLREEVPPTDDPSGRGKKLLEALSRHRAAEATGGWKERVIQLRALPPLLQLRLAHRYVNSRITFRNEFGNQWQSPQESFARGGDCEDYAIAKMALLMDAGYAEENLRVVTLAPARFYSPFHVVLVAKAGDNLHVLDSPDRVQAEEVTPVEKWLDAARPVSWAGWTGGAAFGQATLNLKPTGSTHGGGRRRGGGKSLPPEDRLVYIAADLYTVKRWEQPLTPEEVRKLKQMRAYYRQPSPAHAKGLSPAETGKLASLRKRFEKYLLEME